MSKCVKCKKNKKLVHLPSLEPVCSGCFCAIIEKRIRKRIRLNKLFKKGDRILVKDELSFFLVKRIIKDLPVKLFRKSNKNGKMSKIVTKRTIDDKLSDYLENIFFGRKMGKNRRTSILDVITDNEALMFSKINKIKFKPNKKDLVLVNMLDRLEKKYPEIRFSLSKSVSELGK